MKRIYITLIVLLAAMVTLAYLYFSKLNRDTNDNEISLYAATAKSGLIFSFQNDKRVLDLLKSQDLLQSLLPEGTLQSLEALQRELLSIPQINQQINNHHIYLSFIPGENKNLEFLLSTQINEKQDPLVILNLLKARGINVEQLADLSKITLKDSSSYYLGQKKNLLLLSGSIKAVFEGLKATEEKNNPEFIEYIKSNFKLSKNSLAVVYLNFNYQEGLQQLISPEKFKRKDAFANYSYSFSKDRILFNGNTTVNDKNSYLNLFSTTKPDRITIDAILPESTANYTIYVMDNYAKWRKGLAGWFAAQNKIDQVEKTINRIKSRYHLNLEETFPKYFKNQLVTFQLKSTETFGAVNLSNGDKLSQLLLDVSSDYNEEIKRLKEPDLLYAYFGEPFEKFKTPYYIIIDNYMVFSNYPSSMQVFLNSYKNDRQLINNKAYTETGNQLIAQSNIVYYVNHKNSEKIAMNNLHLPYFELYNDKNKLGRFDNFIYQLSSDGKKFQTNILISKTANGVNDTIPDSSID
jgi:hypothetical protein